jgi:cell wall-associated NlpC family hydrolase
VTPLSDTERAEFIARCRELLGVRFRHQGRTERGLDCAGLPALAFARIGRAIADLPAYGRDPFRDGLQQAIEANLGAPVDDEPRPGDVLLIHWGDGPPRHIAVCVDHPHGLGIIHTCSSFRRVIEHALDATWRSRICGVYRP